MALIEDDSATPVPEICSCTDKCTAGAVNTSCPVCKNDLTKCSGKTSEEPEPEKPEKKNNSMGMLALLLIVGVLGGGTFLEKWNSIKLVLKMKLTVCRKIPVLENASSTI
ncbi:CD1107 family mobile element protein [Clostridium sp. C105KSO13]|uniref:CD1107 family mobile element protein n=1 Tax=Clostridium sp. C105KSO13 TaxID=1776045 RepID=UPI0007406B30|nr:DUF4366 domain-containing protein [Clostridium sp. C105KSO13]CUX40143.1 hypothetical protein BN3456_02042 [Clostridium sp. C105KSO13]